MISTQKCLPRRTVLRGLLGSTIALPLLDAMVPAHAALRKTAASPVRRLGIVYVPMGAPMDKWTPATEGPLQLSPSLRPLAPFQDRVLVLTGLDSEAAIKGRGAATHSTALPAWLTTASAREEGGIRAGISMDQVAARAFDDVTQFASLELGLEPFAPVGKCEVNFSCVYSSTLSWRGPTTPLPSEHSPQAVFERLFGISASTEPSARLAYIRRSRSILDTATAETARLQHQLGPGDRVKVNEYLDAVRDVERRLQRAEEQKDKDLPVVAQPAGVPASYEEYAKVMFDLLLLAYQSDLTRVSTLMMGRELSVRAYTEIGVAEPHHPLSHHQDNPEKLAMLAKINVFHLTLFASFLERLRSTPDGDGSLLDHTLLLYGSGLSNSNHHVSRNLPTLVVGGPTFGMMTGRHLRYPSGTPLANLHVALLNRLGIQHVDRFGDSSGELSGL